MNSTFNASIFSFLFSLLMIILIGNPILSQQSFDEDNLAIIVTSGTTSNTTASIIEINKSTVSQPAIQTIAIPSTGTSAIRVSGSATSTLYASNSNDGSLFCFTGHNSENTSANANTLNPRAVVTLNNSGEVSLQTTYTGSSGNQTRSATSINNEDWYIGDQGGFYTNGSTSASPTGNIRSVKSFGGIVYGFVASASLPPVGIISAPTGGTYTALPGLPVGAASRQDFYLVSSGENGSVFDILYVLNATSGTAGSIFKYSLVDGLWQANGTNSTSFGGFGLAAEKTLSGSNLYVTTGTGSTAANSVRKLIDAAGYNETINITDDIILYTTGAGTIIKGLAFAPKLVITGTITITGTLDAVNTTYGTASTMPSEFTVSGEDLTNDITITAPAGYEISTDINSGYNNTIILTEMGGIILETTIFVRLSAFATVAGSPYVGDIVCASGGSPTQTIATASSTVAPLNITTTGALAEDKTYDATNTATIIGATAVGTVNGDGDEVTGGGIFEQSTVGNDLAVTPNLIFSGLNASSYILEQPTGLMADILVKELTISGLTADNKVFDGTTTATLSGTAELIGIVGMDDVVLGGTPEANFAQAEVGNDIPVSVTGYSISGTHSDNYSLTQPQGLTANITSSPAPVINSDLVFTSTYGDMALTYTITATNNPISYNAVGLPSGLTVNNVNGEITGTPTAIPGDYEVVISATNDGGTGEATLIYTISPKVLTVTDAIAENKIYDGTDDAIILGSNLVGVVMGDDVQITNIGVFDNKNAGSNKEITSIQTLTGADAIKYEVVLPIGLQADINQKELIIQNAMAEDKIFDGNTTATLTGTLFGVIMPDDVNLVLAGNFDTPDVGIDIPVTSTSTIGGMDVDNYFLTQPTGLTADIIAEILVIANWTYEPLEGTTANPTPNIGNGTSSLVGSMGSPTTATGSTAGCVQNTGTNAWQIGTANPGTTNESSGVEFSVPTTGYENIRFRYDHRFSNAATRTVRVQYTLDGTNWTNFEVTTDNYNNACFNRGGIDNGRIDVSDPEGNNASDSWSRRNIDFSSLTGANNNPNFGVRLLAGHYASTGQFRQANNVNSVATAGTWRIDNVLFEGEATDAPDPIAVNLSVSSNEAEEASSTVITVTATTSEPVIGNQTVALTVTGMGITADDYYLSNNTITIANGDTLGSVTFIVLDDAVLESDEVATLTIGSPSAGLTLGDIITQDILIRENNCSFLRKVGTATSLNGAEIPAFDPESNRIYVGAGDFVEYYTLSNVGTPELQDTIMRGFSIPTGTRALPNSVAIQNGNLAVAYAIQNIATMAQDSGRVAFYQASTGAFIHVVTVGFLPDMVTFAPDGSKVLTADEGEPNSYGQGNSFDPEGSVSIIDISNGIENATVQIAGFTSFNDDIVALRNAGVRIFGPGATVAQDLEPEYIAFSGDGLTAFVSLQENNAFGVIDVVNAVITNIIPLGTKDFNLAGNGFDASDRDSTASTGKINIQNWPVHGLYQPDAIASYVVNGQTYYLSANEGDSRDYPGFSEDRRVGSVSYVLDPTIFPNAATLKLPENLGRLQVTSATGDTDNDGDFDRIEVYGARSFSIWDASGAQVFDSGDQFEQLTAQKSPGLFNSEGTSATFDTRSDNKGPEPEGIVVGYINDVPYAFIGIERSGDIMVYNIANPNSPTFVQYINTPNDIALEGLTFVSAENSPTKKPLLITASEGSKTLTVYEVGNAIVTNPANEGSGSLRAVIECVVDGGIVTYDQPTTTTTILTEVLTINKNVSILGLSETEKPEITVDFSSLGMMSGLFISGGKTVYIKDVDFKDTNNTQNPNNAIIELEPSGILNIRGSSIINKID